MHNKEVLKANMDLTAKQEQIMKKYGIRLIGGWSAIIEHLQVLVYDAPNIEALTKAAMEPELALVLSYSNNKLLPVITLEETMKLMK